jgi:hypothetical protein
VVFGVDEDKGEVYVSDRGANPITIGVDDLMKARGSKYPPSPPEHKLISVERKRSDVDLAPAIREGIIDCCRQMLTPPIANIGLRGMKKWASLVTSAWPKTFQGSRLTECLLGTFTNIQIGGTGGSAFRTMYARFLDEASRALDQAKLKEVAEMYREAARCWDRVSEAALPDSNEILKSSRELLLEKNRYFEDQGPDALEAMTRVSRELGELRAKAHEGLSELELKDILENLKARILECCSAETTAIRALSATMDRPATGFSMAAP